MDSKTLKTRALDHLAGNWGVCVGVALVAALLGGLICGANFSLNYNIDEATLRHIPSELIPLITAFTSVMGFVGLVQFILGGTINLGYGKFLLDQHDGRELQFNTLFSQFDRFGQGFVQKFLRNLYIALWSLLFVIPGIVKTYSYAMTPYIMIDHPELTANQAITASRQMMDGHKGELFWLELTFIGWDILSAFTLGIGSLFLNPYRNAAHAAFYRQLAGGMRYTSYE